MKVFSGMYVPRTYENLFGFAKYSDMSPGCAARELFSEETCDKLVRFYRDNRPYEYPTYSSGNIYLTKNGVLRGCTGCMENSIIPFSATHILFHGWIPTSAIVISGDMHSPTTIIHCSGNDAKLIYHESVIDSDEELIIDQDTELKHIRIDVEDFPAHYVGFKIDDYMNHPALF